MIKAFITATTIVAAVTSPVFAQDLAGTLAKVQETGQLVIGHRDSSLPFSYYDDQQNVVGYAMDICYDIADAVQAHLGLDELDVQLVPVTPSTRIPLLANGTIDLECGSTSNTTDRQTQVGFAITHYVVSPRFVSKISSGLETLEDLRGQTIVSTAGTTPLQLITELNVEQDLGINIISANDHAEAFLMVETDRAAAFFMDDILLYSLAANSRNSSDYVISEEGYGVEPYGIMVRRDDPEFKAVADAAISELYASDEFTALYEKWFQQPIPPQDVNLNVPISSALQGVIENPTDSADPADYQ